MGNLFHLKLPIACMEFTVLYHDNNCHLGVGGGGMTLLFKKLQIYKIFMTKTKTIHTNHTLQNNFMYAYIKFLDHGDNCLNEVDKYPKRSSILACTHQSNFMDKVIEGSQTTGQILLYG